MSSHACTGSCEEQPFVARASRSDVIVVSEIVIVFFILITIDSLLG
jgi:hypothetical protein